MNDNLLPNADILAVVESLKPKEKTVEEIAAAISPEKMHDGYDELEERHAEIISSRACCSSG